MSFLAAFLSPILVIKSSTNLKVSQEWTCGHEEKERVGQFETSVTYTHILHMAQWGDIHQTLNGDAPIQANLNRCIS